LAGRRVAFEFWLFPDNRSGAFAPSPQRRAATAKVFPVVPPELRFIVAGIRRDDACFTKKATEKSDLKFSLYRVLWVMDEKERAIFERIAQAQEEIAGLMKTPENKIIKALTIASLSSGALGAGLFSIIQKLLEFFGG
jgi:hypothetical protein